MNGRILFFCLSVCVVSVAFLSRPPPGFAQMDPDTAASQFGQRPVVWGMRLSPDGLKVSFLKRHPEGFPLAAVMDLTSGKMRMILASDGKRDVDLMGCQWANSTRLLCSYYSIQPRRGDFFTVTRLVAVDADGSDPVVLAQRKQRDEAAFHQADVIDLLPDQPNAILMPVVKDFGQGVSRVDIYKNKLRVIQRAKRHVWGLYSDGHGNVRIRRDFDRHWVDYQYRVDGQKKWRRLHRYRPEELDDDYAPIGFGKDPSRLYVWDSHEGRISLFAEKLEEEVSRELVFSHPSVDLSRFLRLGKYDRPVGVAYTTEKPTVHYFDEAVKAVHDRVASVLPDEMIWVVDESWDRRFYLVYASSDVKGGRYYRFDTEGDALALIAEARPWLDEASLVPMVAVSYPAEDGTQIPGYLTRDSKQASEPRPAIVLPHGGIEARDEWGYDWLAQFFASRGYVVLQANYRGSYGYGRDWLGDGVFQGWRRAIADIERGAQYLVDEKIADPKRICIAGWDYGGYAALMSAIAYPDRYRCVIGIAGITEPVDLVSESRGLSRKFMKALVTRDPEVIRAGSPLRRAAELKAPVLLFHGEKDISIPVEHSRQMSKALAKTNEKAPPLVEYEGDDHFLRRQRNRIDMLQRIGDFLDAHLGPPSRNAAQVGG